MKSPVVYDAQQLKILGRILRASCSCNWDVPTISWKIVVMIWPRGVVYDPRAKIHLVTAIGRSFTDALEFVLERLRRSYPEEVGCFRRLRERP